MKKYILALGVCCMAGAMPLFAQESNSELTEAQRELQGYMDEGLVKFKSDNDKFSFRVGVSLSTVLIISTITPTAVRARNSLPHASAS
jgi:hypothetical protein